MEDVAVVERKKDTQQNTMRADRSDYAEDISLYRKQLIEILDLRNDIRFEKIILQYARSVNRILE